MHVLPLALAAVLAIDAAPVPAVAPVPVSAPALAGPPREAPALVGVEPAAPPPARPVAPAPVAPADAATPAPAPTAAPPATAAPAAPAVPVTPAATARPSAPPPPTPQAAVEKLGQGDRAFLERDYRNALFAYQDAVYLAPRSAVARVKLGRAYLALRYPAQAIAQAEQALAIDPESVEARRLAEEARNPPPRPAPPAPAAPPRPAASAAAAETPASAAPQPRVFRFTPEPEPAAETAATRLPAVAEAAAAPAARAFAAAAQPEPARAEPPAAAPSQGEPAAAQHYRAALALLQDREFEKAAAALDDAIALDPRLAVAYAARASARFGLGRYREAADDYRASLGLDANLATPLYGLAECYRVLGDSKHASEMYERYAESRAADVRPELRDIAAKRARELR